VYTKYIVMEECVMKIEVGSEGVRIWKVRGGRIQEISIAYNANRAMIYKDGLEIGLLTSGEFYTDDEFRIDYNGLKEGLVRIYIS